MTKMCARCYHCYSTSPFCPECGYMSPVNTSKQKPTRWQKVSMEARTPAWMKNPAKKSKQ